MLVVDDLDVVWVVRKDDPGHEVVRRLGALGFEWVVLPWQVLAGVRDAGVGDWLPNPSELDKEHVRSGLRMNDCLLALGVNCEVVRPIKPRENSGSVGNSRDVLAGTSGMAVLG